MTYMFNQCQLCVSDKCKSAEIIGVCIVLKITYAAYRETFGEDHKAKAFTFSIHVIERSPVGCASFLDKLC